MESRNIFNNPNVNAVPSGGGNVTAANAVTTNTLQTITASKVFVAPQTFQSNLIGSTTSNLHIHDIYMKGDDPIIFMNETQIDSTALANDSELVKTVGDFTLNGLLTLPDLNVTGNINTSDTSELSVNHLKLKGSTPLISIFDGIDYTPLSSVNLSDYNNLVKTNTDHTITGQIQFTQVPKVNETNLITADQMATLEISDDSTHAPVNGVIQSGENLFTEASPAPICVTDQQARVDSYYLYHDKFLPYIMGYNDLAKTNTYAHGLVPAGDETHTHQFLRKDGQWAQPSITYSGTVSQVLTDLRDYPSSYTGAEGKYLKCTFGSQHPDGAGVEFAELNTDVVPIIAETLANNTLTSIKCNGVIEGQQILVTSDERLKTNIEEFDDGISLIKRIQTKSYKYVNSDKTNIGIMAQDLLRDNILKESVHKTESGFLKVDYTNLIGVLLNSVKQLIKKVERIEGGK